MRAIGCRKRLRNIHNAVAGVNEDQRRKNVSSVLWEINLLTYVFPIIRLAYAGVLHAEEKTRA